MSEPVAIVGFSCRFPGGVTSLEALWSALRAAQDLVTEVPPDRFDAAYFLDKSPQRPGKTYSAFGGFLHDIGEFDADFFRISPREASRMDPQQRLVLEMAVEALDDAAIDPDSVAGSETGVFIGTSAPDYGGFQGCKPETIDAYSPSGIALSITANRLSHFLDARGPSMVVDTACSSSSVALHQACESLRRGESEMALAGGIHLLLSPFNFIGFAKAQMLSPTGRCQTFSANADGYVRAEGGGVAVLKPLSAALAAGDRVHAVLRGTAMNNDGRTMGIALPNAEAQEALLRRLYDRCEIDPGQVAYFEAHGTGTLVGDPAECQAIGRALGVRRTAGPLPVGSVKSNLGHLEPASGMAGLAKAMLVLRHRAIPASLHATPLNPEIDFAGLGLEPVTDLRPLPEAADPVVGVNSFGFGGVNVHAILSPPPSAGPEPDRSRPRHEIESGTGGQALPFIVSARGAAALAEAARLAAKRLAGADAAEFPDLCHTAARRARHEHRMVALAATPADAAAQLESLAEGEPVAGAAMARGAHHGNVAFAFSGNGSQWPGMGAALCAENPVFRAAVEEIDAVFAPLLGWSVLAELGAAEGTRRATLTEFAQPMLFVLQAGLVRVLAAEGVVPAAVIGYSVGEVAAAWAAGALDLADAAQVLLGRSRAQAATAAGQGAMAAVGLPPADARAVLARYGGLLEIAAINGDRDVTVSGDTAALADLERDLAADEVFVRRLDIDYAFHSWQMDAAEQPLRAALAGLRPTATRIPMISTVTGQRVHGTELDGDYWWRNTRLPVLFGAGATALAEERFDVVVEISPHPVLGSYLRRVATAEGHSVVPIAAMTRQGDAASVGATVSAAVLAASPRAVVAEHFPRLGRVVDLPAYPWQRERHWHGDPAWWPGGSAEHPLLGRRASVAEPTWEGEIGSTPSAWLTDHRIGEAVVVPATAYVEMALAAGRRALGASVEVADLQITSAFVLPGEEDEPLPRVQTSVSDEDGVVRVASKPVGDGQWRVHARGRVRHRGGPAPAPVDLQAVRDRLGHRLPVAEHYDYAARAGLNYGPAFRVVDDLPYDPATGEVLSAYTYPGPVDGFEAHPAILDGALQAVLPLLREAAHGQAFIPIGVGQARVWAAPTAEGFAHARLRSLGEVEAVFDVDVLDQDGAVAAELRECRLRRFPVDSAVSVEHVSTTLRAASRADDTAPAPLPGTPSELVRAAGPELTALIGSDPEPGDHVGLGELGCRVSALFAVAAFVRILGEETVVSVRTLTENGVSAEHARLVAFLAGFAEDHGLLRRLPGEAQDPRWVVIERPDPLALFRARHVEQGGMLADLTLRGRSGSHLADVLTGKRDSLEMLFSGTGIDTLEHYYSDFPPMSDVNHRAAILVRHLVSAAPPDRVLRVLELGAGTGGTTAAVLPVLPPDRTHYVFTDISPVFFPRAQHRFAAYDFIDYRALELNRDLDEQGFGAGAFDLVIASNVLHATSDLREALGQIRSLLAPGGYLLAAETHRPDFLLPVFGLLPSAWQFTDTDLRPDTAFLPHDRWPAVIADAGFADVIRLGAVQHSHPDDMSVLLAQRPPGPSPVPDLPEAPDLGWLILTEGPGEADLAQALAAKLGATGSPVIVQRAPDDPEDWTPLLPETRKTVCYVVILDADSAEDAPAATEATVRRAMTLKAVSRRCADLPEGRDAHLYLVTHPSGALPHPERPHAPLHAAAWGVARTLANELPDVGNTRISLHRSADPAADAHRLAGELLAPHGQDGETEDEIVLGEGGRFVPRFVPTAPPTRVVAPGDDVPYRMVVRDHGMGFDVGFAATVHPDLGPDEVRVEVRAAALNYRDVLWALGIVPVDALEAGYTGSIAGGSLGIECAGVVVEVGSAVTEVVPGERVLAIAPAAFASHPVTKAALVKRIPPHLGFTEAATLPVAFATVHHSLGTIARLSAGETVLIHGAAGGVGLAAIQHARHVGARIIATAGSEEKRDYLRLIGVEHVLDSRSLEFVHQVLDITDGAGVDVVLNSLAGEYLRRSLDLVRPYGRFIELGKRDLYENKRLQMRPLRNNVMFVGVDLDQALLTHTELASNTLDQIVQRIDDDVYHPLPRRVFPANRIAEAYQLMRHSRHIGKIVIDFAHPVTVECPPRPPRLSAEGTYVVTGGTGGFGAAAAEWLAERGARKIALVSRRGARAPEAEETIARLAARGVAAQAHAVDATDPAAVADLLSTLDSSGHPVRGVLHAAMVLDDDLLCELDSSRFAAALAPKLTAGWVLDALTRDRELDLFLSFSSVAAEVGNLRQANYVAGNVFLSALARRRRSHGLRGSAVAWGAIGEVGSVSRDAELSRFLDQLGFLAISPADAHAALDALAEDRDAAPMAVRAEWNRVARLIPCLETSPRFRYFNFGAVTENDERIEEFRRALSGVGSAEEAAELIENAIIALVSMVLQIPAERVDRERRLDQLGIDSLMAAELLGKFRAHFGNQLSPMDLIGGGNISSLSRLIVRRLGNGLAAPVEGGAKTGESSDSTDISAVSEITVVSQPGPLAIARNAEVEPRKPAATVSAEG